MGIFSSTPLKVMRLTHGPKHHLFGFHDLLISNHLGDKYLALEADIINRPPLPGEKFGVGYIQDGEFVRVGETTAMNYPQGSRQQWIAGTELFTVNNRVGNAWGTDVYDATTNKLVDRYESTTHMLTRDGKYALGLDYARLHRLGGYGYTGIDDMNSNDPYPKNTGISITDMNTKETKLLVSVRQVAECGTSNIPSNSHHYLTHLCLNPSSSRVAFLHRYFMPDGGLMTRLMTVGINGSGLRCLAQGFLSHFDWQNDNQIYIYGRSGSSIDSVRNNPLLRNPFISYSLKTTKKIVKFFIGKNKSLSGGMSFIKVEDSPNAQTTPFAKDTIPHDGHPMTHPFNRDWCVCDTYPDNAGDRELFFYQFSTNTRVNVGTFRRLFDTPDTTMKDKFLCGMDEKILSGISMELIAFTRSGLHCDLHPRWSADGKWAVFDSIHEGSRQIYKVSAEDIII